MHGSNDLSPSDWYISVAPFCSFFVRPLSCLSVKSRVRRRQRWLTKYHFHNFSNKRRSLILLHWKVTKNLLYVTLSLFFGRGRSERFHFKNCCVLQLSFFVLFSFSFWGEQRRKKAKSATGKRKRELPIQNVPATQRGLNSSMWEKYFSIFSCILSSLNKSCKNGRNWNKCLLANQCDTSSVQFFREWPKMQKISTQITYQLLAKKDTWKEYETPFFFLFWQGTYEKRRIYAHFVGINSYLAYYPK